VTPELRQLRYFVAAAEEASFTSAARRLNVAQQSLSQQITVLERALGARLFDRDSRGTRLTEAGQLFLPEAHAVLDRAERAVATVRRAARGETGRLNLAFLSSKNHLLAPVVRTLRQRFPGIELTVADAGVNELVAGLGDGRYDAAFTRPPLVDGLLTRNLFHDQVCAVLPEGHPLAEHTELPLSALADEQWILSPCSSWPPWRREHERVFHAAGFEPNVVQQAGSVQILLGLVAAGVGVARLARTARTAQASGVVFVPLVNDSAVTQVVWHPRADKPALRNMLDAVAELAATTDLARSA
jgi:DNA-binding transcriptional LysR family regulator